MRERVTRQCRRTPRPLSREPDYPQQNIVIDRERAALLGLSVAQIAKAIQTFINGYEASIFSDPNTGNQYDITVRAQESDRISLSDLSQIFVFNAQGRPIPLDNVVSNLPAKVGNELLTLMLHDARCRLRPGGQLLVVTNAGLKEYIKRSLAGIFGNYEKVKQGRAHIVARAVRQ